MTESGKALENINEKIALLRYELEQAGKLGLNNLAKHCENLVLQLLNAVYDIHLINLNQQSRNYPGLDLGDEGNNIAYQVTTIKTSEKMNDALRKCLDHENYKSFQFVNVFILTEKQQSYSIHTITEPHFNFDPSKNIIDFTDFLRSVSDLPLDKIKAVERILHLELPAVIENLKRQSQLWNIPQMRNAYFSGREEVLAKISTNLTTSGASGLSQAISGLGGIGKTQIAIEYAYRFREDYNAYFWVGADTEVTLASGFTEIAKMLGLEEAKLSDQAEDVKAAVTWLETHAKWLLILDNADSPSLLKPFIPKNPQGHILVTSRARILDSLGIPKPILLAEMGLPEALAFILKRTGRDGDGEESKNFARELIHELGYFPLAIEQAGAFILTYQTRFEDYLAEFRRNKLQLLSMSKPVTGEYERTVTTTWGINFADIEQNHPTSADILRLSAFLSPESIPLELIQNGYFGLQDPDEDSHKDRKIDAIGLDMALEPLTRFSLIRRSVSSSSYDIHRLVQEVIKEDLLKQQQREWVLKAVRSINAIFPSGSFDTWSTCDRLLSHAVLCAKWVEEYNFTYLDAGNLLNGIACYLRMRARYAESEKIHLQSVAIRQRDLGADDLHVSEALNNLACVYLDLYAFAKAEPFLKRALHVKENALGPNHHELGIYYSNLGAMYVRWGKPDIGKPLLEHALELEASSPEPEEFFYAIVKNNLAECHIGMQDLAAAEPLARESLNLREKIGNPEKTVRSYGTMGNVLYRKGDMAGADVFFKKAMALKEEIYGKNHPELIQVLINYVPYLADNNRVREWRMMNEQLQSILTTYNIVL